MLLHQWMDRRSCKSLPSQVTSPHAAAERLGSGLHTAASCRTTAQMEVIFIGNTIPKGPYPSAICTVSEQLLSQASGAGTWCQEERGVCFSPLCWPGPHLKQALPHSRATLAQGSAMAVFAAHSTEYCYAVQPSGQRRRDRR